MAVGPRLQTLFGTLVETVEPGSGQSPGVSWSTSPDFTFTRVLWSAQHETLWALPIHDNAATNLPEDFPLIGGRSFEIIGDGNPRLLIDGADPRVIQGSDNPQYDQANYAASGIAYGSGRFHRVLVDRPLSGQTFVVQLHVDGTVIQYTLTAQ